MNLPLENISFRAEGDQVWQIGRLKLPDVVSRDLAGLQGQRSQVLQWLQVT